MSRIGYRRCFDCGDMLREDVPHCAKHPNATMVNWPRRWENAYQALIYAARQGENIDSHRGWPAPAAASTVYPVPAEQPAQNDYLAAYDYLRRWNREDLTPIPPESRATAEDLFG